MLEEFHQLLGTIPDAVYAVMTQGLVLCLKPKAEFLPLFNLNVPIPTGDSGFVTKRMDQS